eukprot:scaffold60349_cov57-Phaeocystis_antarctica.AAC.3
MKAALCRPSILPSSVNARVSLTKDPDLPLTQELRAVGLEACLVSLVPALRGLGRVEGLLASIPGLDPRRPRLREALHTAKASTLGLDRVERGGDSTRVCRQAMASHRWPEQGLIPGVGPFWTLAHADTRR